LTISGWESRLHLLRSPAVTACAGGFFEFYCQAETQDEVCFNDASTGQSTSRLATWNRWESDQHRSETLAPYFDSLLSMPPDLERDISRITAAATYLNSSILNGIPLTLSSLAVLDDQIAASISVAQQRTTVREVVRNESFLGYLARLAGWPDRAQQQADISISEAMDTVRIMRPAAELVKWWELWCGNAAAEAQLAAREANLDLQSTPRQAIKKVARSARHAHDVMVWSLSAIGTTSLICAADMDGVGAIHRTYERREMGSPHVRTTTTQLWEQYSCSLLDILVKD
jgi:hypothetical protein